MDEIFLTYCFILLYVSGAMFGYWLNDVIRIEKDCRKYKEYHDEQKIR